MSKDTQIQKQIEEAVERATKNIFIELFADLSEEIIKIDDKGAYTKTKNVIRKELLTIATKSAEAGVLNKKALETGLKNFRRLRLIEHEPLMDEAPPAETVLSVLKSGLGGMFDDQAVSYIYEKAIRYYLKALSKEEQL